MIVFAAASLKNALDAVNAQWQKETGKKAVVSYAASSALARQIESGAPAHLFLSADLDWMSYLADKRLIQNDTRVNLLGNRLVLIAPAIRNDRGSRSGPRLRHGCRARSRSSRPGCGSGRGAGGQVRARGADCAGRLGLSLPAKSPPAENVRAALLLVSRGEAPFGIVYYTDAVADSGVRIVDTFPETTHPPIIYPVALTAGATHPDAAAFLAYRHLGEGQARVRRRMASRC